MMYPKWLDDVSYLPLSAPARCWVPFRLSKQRLSNSLSQHQSNSQAELSKPTRKTNQKSFRIHIHIPSSLQCDVCIPSHVLTRSVTKRRASPHWKKTFYPPEKMSWTYCMHDHCFRTCYRCTIWVSVRIFFAPLPLVSIAGYGSAGDCCIVTSVSYATQLSLFTIKFCRFNIKF